MSDYDFDREARLALGGSFYQQRAHDAEQLADAIRKGEP